MKNLLSKKYIYFFSLIFLQVCTCYHAQVITETFTLTNSTQTFVTPYCTSNLTVTVIGAGGNGPWGQSAAGIVTVVMTPTPGQVLYMNVGGAGNGILGGWNGGGNGGIGTSSVGGGGGGASDIRLGNNLLSSRIIVMGGGGGSSSWYNNSGLGGSASIGIFNCSSSNGNGGESGYGYATAAAAACAGVTNTNYGGGGGGGGMTSGGGTTGSGAGGFGQAGNLGQGGNGGGSSSIYGGSEGGVYGAGGGGGGYYGGAGGMCGAYPPPVPTALYASGGGGAGSSYVDPVFFSNSISGGTPMGDGIIFVKYTYTSSAISIVGTPSICPGSSISINGTGVSSYTWLPVGTFSGSNTQSISDYPSTTTTYTVVGTNSVGCVSAAVLTIPVFPISPTINVSTTNTSGVCPGSTVNISASGALTYAWTGGITNGVPFVASSSQTYVVTGSNGCGTNTAIISMSVHPLPLVGVAAIPTLVCFGSSVTLAGTGAVSYIWTNTNITNGASFSPSVSASYTVIGTSVQSCTNFASISLSIVTTPTTVPSISQNTLCVGGSAILSAGPALSYFWLPINVNTASVAVSPTSSIVYTLLQANGPCSDSKTISLIVYPLPTPTAVASPTLVCPSSSVILSGMGGISYSWLSPTLSPVFGATVTVYPTQATTYTLLASDGNCIGNATIQINTTAAPIVTISANTNSICAGGSVSLTASGALSYTWNTIAAPNNSSIVLPAMQSSSLITVNGINSIGCTNLSTIYITVFPNPTVTLTTNKSLVCPAQNTTLFATGASSFQWTISSLNQTSLVVNPIVSTNYSVTGFNSNGCSDTKTIGIDVFTPSLNINASTTVCAGSSVSVQLTGAISYSLNGLPVSSVTVLLPQTSSNYSFGATSTSANVTCITNKIHPITIYSLPTVSINTTKKILCQGETGTLNATGAITYSWNTGSTGNIYTYTAIPVQMYFTVFGTDINGCENSDVIQINVSKCTQIEHYDLSDQLNIYPNPSADEINIQSQTELHLELVNNLGQVVKFIELMASNNYTLKITDLAQGIYYLTFDSTGYRSAKKIIISH